MADNTRLNPGDGGDLIATDEIAGVKHQLVKVEYGGADSATQVSPTNPLPVTATGGASYANITSTGSVKGSAGTLVGVFVASSSSGTIKLWDNTSAATTILVNTFSVSAGTWYPLPFKFGTGLFATIGGTLDCTFSYT